MQPCFSPVWDTALAVNALAMSRSAGDDRPLSPSYEGGARAGLLDDALARASRWLLDREVRRPGDWSLLNPNLEPAGLVLRVSQRLLSRHRRYGDGADGPGAPVRPGKSR